VKQCFINVLIVVSIPLIAKATFFENADVNVLMLGNATGAILASAIHYWIGWVPE
jgi:hypothetical protein